MGIDLNALRSEVDRKDAERKAPRRQWDKLPAGTLVYGSATRDTPFPWRGRDDDPTWAEKHGWNVHPSEFANAYKRDDLAKLGFFSVDDPAHRERRRADAFEEAKRFSAAQSLGIDRDALLNRVAARLESTLTGGVWAKSSAEFYKIREALDNALLYAAGVTTHA